MKHIVLKNFKSKDNAEKYIAECNGVISYRIAERTRNKDGHVTKYFETAVQLPVPEKVLKAISSSKAEKSAWIENAPEKT